ncbi:M20/M25/M40 family metallo-hydrolase, partial [Frankia sp. Mgl5]|uniref:M20/M25/M40 family metallo-hydrolase n=1 Tax=Frankia sp. Mgl5 TaxID=2933793 RepID=UPI00200D6151
AAVEVVGLAQVEKMKPLMIGEDFSYYLERVPGAYIMVGAGNPELGASFPHHHPRFDVDERAMLIAAEVLGRTALAFLHAHCNS